MATKPLYGETMKEMGCGKSNASSQLEQKIKDQSEKIDTLTKRLTETEEKLTALIASLIEVKRFDGEASFLAIDSNYSQQSQP